MRGFATQLLKDKITEEFPFLIQLAKERGLVFKPWESMICSDKGTILLRFILTRERWIIRPHNVLETITEDNAVAVIRSKPARELHPDDFWLTNPFR